MKSRRGVFLLLFAAVSTGVAVRCGVSLPLPLEAILHRIDAVSLVGLLLIVSGSLGARMVSFWFPQEAGDEMAVQHYALGLGIIGTILFVTGSIAAFSRGIIFAIILAAAWIGRNHLSRGLAFLRLPSTLKRLWIRSDGVTRLVYLLASMMLLVALMEALVPPFAYDSLMYHLRAPQLFLAEGRILTLPELWQANGPLLIQMLYGAGMAAGSDLTPAVLHLATGVMLVLATFHATCRLGGEHAAWLALAILLGVPAILLWSALPYADVAWALFQFLSLDALLQWSKEGEDGWLYLAGAQLGFALGSKYLALGFAVAIGLFFLVQIRRNGFQRSLRAVILIALAAGITAAPWYLRNALILGNPVFPFYFGGAGWGLERADQLLSYMHSFGRQHLGGLIAFWDIFFNPRAYRTMGVERLTPAFLVAFLVLMPAQRKKFGVLGFFVLAPLIFWWFGSRQLRFLLPLLPVAAILAGLMMQEVLDRLRASRAAALLIRGVLLVLMGVTLFNNFAIVYELQFFRVMVGMETREAFLARTVYDYPGIRAALEELNPEEQILFLWDGQGYYCRERCIADADQAGWINLRRDYGSHAAIAAALRAGAVDLLLVGKGDAAWMIEHDPTGAQEAAYDDFMGTFIPRYTERLYEDEQILVVRLLTDD